MLQLMYVMMVVASISTTAIEAQEVQTEPIVIEVPQETESQQELEHLGKFRITHYCGCRVCNGKWAGQPTASGTYCEAGRTIAVYKKQIPLGSKVMIDGHEYTAEDTGSAIKTNCIDIYVDDHNKAKQLGVYYTDVYLIK